LLFTFFVVLIINIKERRTRTVNLPDEPKKIKMWIIKKNHIKKINETKNI